MESEACQSHNMQNVSVPLHGVNGEMYENVNCVHEICTKCELWYMWLVASGGHIIIIRCLSCFNTLFLCLICTVLYAVEPQSQDHFSYFTGVSVVLF